MTKIDKELLREAIPVDQYYRAELGEPQSDKYFCPFHPDKKNPNLSADEKGFKCFACGEGGDIFGFHEKITGLPFTEVLKDLAGKYAPHLLSGNGNGNGHKPKNKGNYADSKKNDEKQPTIEEARKAAGENSTVIRNRVAGYAPKGIFQYTCHESGVTFFRLRMDHLKPDEYKKWIMPFSLIKGKWELKEPSFPSGKPLYKSSNCSGSSNPVYVFEGEKMVDAAEKLGLTAVTSGSSSSAGKANWNQIQGCEVIIWPDNDEPGIKYAGAVTEKLLPIDCEVKQIDVEKLNLPVGGDICDWLKINPKASKEDVETLPMLEPEHLSTDENGNDPGGWPEPQPLLRETPPPEPYPVEALGDVVGGVARKAQEIIQCPDAVCAQSLMAGVSLATQAHADVVIDGRVFPLSEFYITIAESGERKTATDEAALSPHNKREKDLRQELSSGECEHEADIAAWKKAREEALSGSKNKTREEKKKALLEIGPEPQKPINAILTCEEPTYEGLVKALDTGWPSMGIFSDEGGRFLGGHGMNSENQLKTISGLSKMWDGKSITRTRAGDGSHKLYGRRLSIHLMLQPNVSQILFGNSLLTGQGFLSRCLVSYPKSTIGDRKYNESSLVETSESRHYFRAMMGLLESPLPLAEDTVNELSPRQMPLSKEAKHIWVGFHDHVENLCKKGKELYPIKGFAAKAAEHAARVAGGLALFESLNATRLESCWMDSGIQIAQYYLGEALRLFNSSQDDEELIKAGKLLSWAKEKGGLIHLRMVLQFGPNSIRDKSTAERMISILIDHGWFRPVLGGTVINGKKHRQVWEVYQ